MTRAEHTERLELFARAAPPCNVGSCRQGVQRAEMGWQRNGDGDWVPGDTYLVCVGGHRRLVEFP